MLKECKLNTSKKRLAIFLPGLYDGGAERILLDHRVRHGLEGGDGQGDWLGDPLEG